MSIQPLLQPLKRASSSIDRILEHRYTNDGRPLARNLGFKVRWLGYWSGLRNTAAVEDHAQLVKPRLPRTRHDA